MSRARLKKASRKRGGEVARNAWNISLTTESDFVYDLNMQALVVRCSVALAHHYRRSLLAGKRPDGRGMQKRVNRRTKKLGPRVSNVVGARTGYMAKHWYLGQVNGSTLRASRLVKPYGGDGGQGPRIPRANEKLTREFVLKQLLAKGVDFQSGRGVAAKIAKEVLADFVRGAVGGRVRTPVRIKRQALLLPQAGRA